MKNFVCRAAVLLAALCLLADSARSQTAALVTSLSNPTNSQAFGAPANIYVHARMVDTNLIQTVQYFSGASFIGAVTNVPGVLVTNLNEGNPFPITWSNVMAGAYSLTAVVRDNAGNVATSAPVSITVTNPVALPAVYIYSPTNGAVFLTPASLTLYARAVELNGTVITGTVANVRFFANSTSLGVVSNSSQAVFTNVSTEPLFPLAWSNVLAGTYALKAVATDLRGNSATSSVVTISVVTNLPPVTVRPSVAIYSPTNGATFLTPTNVNIYARATESPGKVSLVQFFANSIYLGVVSNSSQTTVSNVSSEPLFPLTWSNAWVGSYALKTIAFDTNGYTATSSVVNITIVTNAPPPPPVPFVVSFWYPTNGESFLAPATIGVHALVTDSNVVKTMQYFVNGGSIGIITNTGTVLLTNSTEANPFFLSWSNVLAGSYTLAAVAVDTAGNTATSASVNISVTNAPPPVIRPSVGIYSPANGATYTAPANVSIYARAVESTGVVATVQFFANDVSLGVVSNASQVTVSNISTGPLFPFTWSNVPAGAYALHVIAADTSGYTATSSIVNITIITNTPQPPVPFAVSFWDPTNGESFLAPATIGVHAWVTDSNVVRSMQYFANGSSIGVATNSSGVLLTNTTAENPFFLAWSNVSAGSYTLTALAMDSTGNTATSAPVHISVTNKPPVIVPFAVSFWYPTNGQIFVTPATLGVHAMVTDSNVVRTMQYFANGSSIGTVTNSGGVTLTNSTAANPFFLAWSNVPVGNYALTALASDSAGLTATSAPAQIFVVTNLPPTVTIFAPDPVAVAGTNLNWYRPSTCASNYVSGTNTATFLVHRASVTNVDLTVYYAIGGTAVNGEDYATIGDSVIIPAGKSYALITIDPLADADAGYYDTVVLSLVPPPVTNTPPAYLLGSPSQAGAVILDQDLLPIPQPIIRSLVDSSLHVSLPGTNGLNFSLQVSTDMINWSPVCTNTVLKGSAQYVDPAGSASTSLFYRIVPVATPASY